MKVAIFYFSGDTSQLDSSKQTTEKSAKRKARSRTRVRQRQIKVTEVYLAKSAACLQ